MRELHGRCLCGAVSYVIPDSLTYAGYCHCSDCRRFSGSAFSAFGGIPVGDLRIIRGADQIGRYKKTEATLMAFCHNCGSSLFVEKPIKGMVHIRLGTLDEAPSLHPQVHVLVGSKAPWYEIKDDLPQFETVPDRGAAF